MTLLEEADERKDVLAAGRESKGSTDERGDDTVRAARSLAERQCNHSESVTRPNAKNQYTTRGIILGSSLSPYESQRASNFDVLEDPSRALYIIRSPEFLKRVNSTQCLGFCVFKPTLSIPKLSLVIHHPG